MMKRENLGLFVRLLLVSLLTVMIVRTRNLEQMDAQDWLGVLYPALTATSFMVTVVMALYYISVRPIRLVLATTFYFVSETVVLAILTLATGADPVLTMSQYRPLVGWARFFMLLSLFWMIYDAAEMIFRDPEK